MGIDESRAAEALTSAGGDLDGMRPCALIRACMRPCAASVVRNGCEPCLCEWMVSDTIHLGRRVGGMGRSVGRRAQQPADSQPAASALRTLARCTACTPVACVRATRESVFTGVRPGGAGAGLRRF
eukprot:7335029-Prymnesium_polylepis.1